MTTLRDALLATLGAVAVGMALTAAPVAAADTAAVPMAPCYNGIAPFNPYVDNCALPQRPPRILGSAPDQTALLNCSVGGAAWRAVCLSQFVNGGPLPGIGIGIGIG